MTSPQSLSQILQNDVAILLYENLGSMRNRVVFHVMTDDQLSMMTSPQPQVKFLQMLDQ